ncbi:hypothetical protein HYS49_03260 [Candidatus Woesearchaeota archaeon]|nr:hypothetical protein [Candidatus Woesearchaeota archaeon]
MWQLRHFVQQNLSSGPARWTIAGKEEEEVYKNGGTVTFTQQATLFCSWWAKRTK